MGRLYLNVFTLFLAIAVWATPQASFADRLRVERSLNDRPWGYNLVRGSEARAGDTFQKFELRAGDCSRDSYWSDCANDRERSEVRVRREWRPGVDQWIGFSVFVPKGFPTSSVWTTIAQIHQIGGPGFPAADGSISRPNHMQFSLTSGQLEVAVWYMTKSGPQSKTWHLANMSQISNRWTDIQLRFDTKNSNGDLEIWLNGRPALNLKDTVTVRPSSYYFKYGIYRGPVSKWGGAVPTQVLYFDEVKFGSTRSDVIVRGEAPVD